MCLVPHINEVTQGLCLCVWLISLSTSSSKSIHVLVTGRISSSFVAARHRPPPCTHQRPQAVSRPRLVRIIPKPPVPRAGDRLLVGSTPTLSEPRAAPPWLLYFLISRWGTVLFKSCCPPASRAGLAISAMPVTPEDFPFAARNCQSRVLCDKPGNSPPQPLT